MSDTTRQELLSLNQRLLESIAQADWETYEQLCDPSLSAFEPEALGQLVEGMPFHHFYFYRGPVSVEQTTTMASPHVRLMGESAIISYVRLIQRIDKEGRSTTVGFEETRVWQRIEGIWKHVHFHRSPLATTWPG